jgi:voltage-gated potassium channel
VEAPRWKLHLPAGRPLNPAVSIARRVGIAVGIVLVNWLLVVVERDGYRDAYDGELSIVDALYYTTVTLSTTGYGDITPVTPAARLSNALLVTPMRFLFVLVLVGTTIQVLTERSKEQFHIARWRSRVKDHVIVCGYGTKGRSAVRALLQRGLTPDRIVVIDVDPLAVADAAAAGHVTVQGSSATDAVLEQALIDRASSVIVALNRDDAAVLTTLTIRQHAPSVPVVASVREEENADLVRQSGADTVITSSAAAGRLLGLATDSPQAVDVLEDLLARGRGLDLVQRHVRDEEVGGDLQGVGAPVIAVVRAGRTLAYDEPGVEPLRPGDRLIVVARAEAAG